MKTPSQQKLAQLFLHNLLCREYQINGPHTNALSGPIEGPASATRAARRRPEHVRWTTARGRGRAEPESP